MKKFFVFVVASMFATQGALASITQIKCDEAKNASRGDSVAKVVYNFDLKKGTVSLGCSVPVDGPFCGSIRMDGSDMLRTLRVDCRDRTAKISKTFLFHLMQEDEFETRVDLTLTQNCRTGELSIPTVVTASVITYNSGEFEKEAPIAQDTVACKVQ